MKPLTRLVRAAILAASFLLPLTGHAFQLWQQTEAGMSIAKVKSLYPQAVEIAASPKNTNGYGFTTRLRIPGGIQIVGREFFVEFMFKDDALGQVTLVSDLPGPRTLQSSNDTSTYTHLVEALRTKYGRELSRGGVAGMPETTWVAGPIMIKANFFTGTLMIFYTAADVGDAGKL